MSAGFKKRFKVDGHPLLPFGRSDGPYDPPPRSPSPLIVPDPAFPSSNGQRPNLSNTPPPVAAPSATASSISPGEKSKARDILAAVRTLKLIESEKRKATPEERLILLRFCGFGPVALSLFPDPLTGKYKDGWQPLGEELRDLLTQEDYDSAKRTTFCAFYTSPTVMQAIHDGLSRLGLPPHSTILEPGCGIGNFITDDHRFIGVELDSLSGRIARVLHPSHDIRIENFRDSKLPPLDAVIGNVPFADIKLDFQGQRFSLHDFFFAKSLDSLKPGGVLALVTSHFTLDKQNAAIREHLASKADFLGAIRLPSDAFKREGTSVVTDIVFLRKRALGQNPNHVDPEWLKVAPLSIDGAEISINRYFHNHPENVLGTWSRKDTLYGSEGFSVLSNGDLADQLRACVEHLPRAEKTAIPETPRSPPFIPPPLDRHITEGSFFVSDQAIYQSVNGQAVPITLGSSVLKANGTMMGKRLSHLIELRDSARRVLQSQNEGWPEIHRAEARRKLNFCYDRFVAAYGPINKTTFGETKDGTTIRRMPNLVKFRDDPDAMLVMALEEYDEATGKAAKAPIMLKDVVGPTPPITTVSSAEEGLLVSLDRKGLIDLGYISQLYGRPEEKVIEELGDLIYHDPETKEWQTADEYLSGNVREKLKAAEQAGPDYARNAEALRLVQPEDLLPGDIDANLGAPWIPTADVEAFARELFKSDGITIDYLKRDAVWGVEADYAAESSVAATSDYGTPRANGVGLFELALNMRSPVVYDTIRTADGEERIVNQEETLAAKEKQRLIKDKFKSWIFADSDRTERLVRIYNDAFNNLRPRLFDGSHLDFPGMSKAFEMRPHQRDAVWRCMSGGNTLLAHAVGAGKTGEVVAAAMKMRQCGLIRRPVVVCPNHMLEQFGREWLQIYPNAKLLIASKDDFTREKRKALTAKIASGDWDGIIVTHSSFERIGMSTDYQQRFLREQIKEYDELLCDGARSNGKNRNIIKTIEKQKAKREEKLKELLAEDKKDSGLVFDELGVDQLFVDECFPYDTLVETDNGPRKIGDIVTGRELVNVKTLNYKTDTVEWKPIVNWFPNMRRGLLVEVYHEHGSFICTPNHKIRTEAGVYKTAGSLQRGEALLGLPGSDSFGSIPQERPEAEILFTRMQSAAQYADEDMSGLSRRVLALPGEHNGRIAEASHILQRFMQDEGAIQEPRVCCKMEEVHAASLGRSANEGTEKSRLGGVHEGASGFFGDSPNAFSDSQGIGAQAAHLVELLVNRASEAPRGTYRHDHGIYYQDPAHQTPDARRATVLPCRPGRPCQDVGSRGRWGQPQPAIGEISRCSQESGLIASRVVGIKILEPDSDGEYRFGGRDHSVVYDIEVADNHNYFANGVLVSNCQAYKNLETPTKMERVAGIQTGGSERAFDLYMKARYLDEKHPGHGLVGASGTPISNSMVEMYTMQKYFDSAGLRSRGIEHFDAWAATFGGVVDTMEIAPDGKSLKPRSRFARFVNLPELQQMFRAFADVQTAEMLDLPRPKLEGGKAQIVACPMSEEQREIQEHLVKRYDRLRSEKVDPREDNALAITTDGRKLALDGRMLSGVEDFAGGKINALVDKVLRIWRETESYRGTQMIFCDMGVNPRPFSAYDEIIEKLVDHGVPREQIATVGDADSDAKKQALFEKVRNGAVRILLGSTQKMGTGTNVQKRLVALHHLDAPWKPAEVEQREGRILRQGNANEEVAIYRYVTEGSFDAYMWQALETKARFINQVMTGESAVRKAEDIGGQELSYAEVKAIASGNPAVLTLAEADAEMQRLAVLKKHHADEQYVARRNIRDLPGTIDAREKRLAGLKADRETLAADDRILLGDRERSNAEALAYLAKRLNEIPERVGQTRRFPLGQYHGLDFGFIAHPNGAGEVYLEGATTRDEPLSRESQGPRAVMNALERIADSYDGKIDRVERELELAKGQLRDYLARQGIEFSHQAYMDELGQLRDRLKLGLSATTDEAKAEVADLAEKVKSLKASHTIEAAPARERRVARAERPVTGRLRKEEPHVEGIAIQLEEERDIDRVDQETVRLPTAHHHAGTLIAPRERDVPRRELPRKGAKAEQMRLF